MSTAAASPNMNANLKQAQPSWGWFVALGIGLIVAGVIASANVFASTIASVIYVGVMMLVGAVLQFVHAFSSLGWKRRTMNILAAVFYAFASMVIVYDPLLSAVDISLVIGALLVGAGIARFISAFHDRSHGGWGWVAASGVATIAVGILILATWPTVGLWLLGMILAVDLISQGWGFLAFGFILKAKTQVG